MNQNRSTTPSSAGHAVVQADDRPHMIRGLINAIVLSLALWLAAGYLAFILR